MTKTALILGANGRFGRAAAIAFETAGWTVRRFDRKADTLPDAAIGADVIVNAWNPLYTDWARDVPRFTRQVIDAARASGATVIVPGNVYVFGADAPDTFSETTPHAAQNHLGRIRIEMEAAYRSAGVRTIILRAGDFIDTDASGNWFDIILTKNLGKGVFTYPGRPDIPHAWAYLPDAGRAAVALAEMRDRLAVFEDVPFPGFTLTGREIQAGLARATGRKLRLKKMSYLPIWAVAPFWRMGRRILEMRYLWSKPHHLDGSKFRRLLPDFRPTPVETALASAVDLDVHPDKPMVRAGRPVAAH
jgi:nucleoside-diphosphate-sugar epimerase